MQVICILFSILIHSVLSYTVAPISEQKFLKPYNPSWDEVGQRLLMADYTNGTLLCYWPDENRIYLATVDGITTPWYLLLVDNTTDHFATSRIHTNSVIRWDCKSSTGTLIRDTFTVDTDPRYASHNWHTAKASPQHQFYGGTLRANLCGDSAEPNAAGYSYDKCNGVKTIISNVKIFGGIEWNANGDRFYRLDSCTGNVWEHHYDKKTGKLCNGRIVFRYQRNYGDPTGVPLGMTIDTAGLLYITIYLGGVVLIVDPEKGVIIDVIVMPAEIVAGIAWGGRNLDILYVTTFSSAKNLNTGDTITDRTFSAGSGMVYAVTGLGARGMPARSVRL